MTATTTEPAMNLTIADFNPAVHDGEVTLTSPRTGDHRTFRIRTVRDQDSSLCGRRILYLLVGSNNESPGDWAGFAFVDEFGRCNVWRRYKADGQPSLHQKFAHMIEAPEHWAAKGVGYAVSLRCRRCGKLLTRPDSIRDGLGADCRKMMGA
jgi:hypothetical protein